MLVPVMDELREDHADRRRAALVHLDLPSGIVGLDDEEEPVARRASDFDEIVDRTAVGPADPLAEPFAGEKLDVPLLRSDQMLERAVDGPIGPASGHVEDRRIDLTAEVEQRAVDRKSTRLNSSHSP